ncbi:MAG: hypothetical protein Q8O89_02340 [Nanoarchaeota archaeon]|nr:hypothetical protein [Nanoarchaeota archaeon]
MAVDKDTSDSDNYSAYRRMEESGELKPYEGKYVVFHKGKLVSHNEDRDVALKDFANQPVFYMRVLREGESPVVKHRGPMLHRIRSIDDVQ